MLTVLLQVLAVLPQIVCTLALAYGAFLSLSFAFGNDAPRPEASTGSSRDFKPRLADEAT